MNTIRSTNPAKQIDNILIRPKKNWNGFEWGKDLERKEKLIAWINSQNPDVVALQELCGYTKEKLLKDAIRLDWIRERVALLRYLTKRREKEGPRIQYALTAFWPRLFLGNHV